MSFIKIAMPLLCALIMHQAAAAPLVLKDDYLSPRNAERPLRKATTLIVLHTTEAPAKSSLNKLSERGEAHYCVTEQGIVYRIVDKNREAFHAGRSMWKAKEDCDEYSIGIEVVGHHDKSMPLAQIDALKELVRRLKSSYGIPDASVVCHSHVAYGAPNTWHRKKHRGRKRCGMLFAMPSVRARLGLAARPAYDPDIRAGRLVQGDEYLAGVLYGRTDTMTAFYGSRPPPAAKAVAKKSSAAKPAASSARKPKPAAVASAKPASAKPASAKPSAAAKSAAAKGAANGKKGEWLRLAELKGGSFKHRAKFVEAKAMPASAPSRRLPLPKNLVVGKAGDDVRDLEALAKLPGYVRGGPVSRQNTPYKIAGAAWKSASTYYYTPRGKILRGDRVDEKSVEPGTWVFYKK